MDLLLIVVFLRGYGARSPTIGLDAYAEAVRWHTVCLSFIFLSFSLSLIFLLSLRCLCSANT
jgi:hypothetical protein